MRIDPKELKNLTMRSQTQCVEKWSITRILHGKYLFPLSRQGIKLWIFNNYL